MGIFQDDLGIYSNSCNMPLFCSLQNKDIVYADEYSWYYQQIFFQAMVEKQVLSWRSHKHTTKMTVTTWVMKLLRMVACICLKTCESVRFILSSRCYFLSKYTRLPLCSQEYTLYILDIWPLILKIHMVHPLVRDNSMLTKFDDKAWWWQDLFLYLSVLWPWSLTSEFNRIPPLCHVCQVWLEYITSSQGYNVSILSLWPCKLRLITGNVCQVFAPSCLQSFFCVNQENSSSYRQHVGHSVK